MSRYIQIVNSVKQAVRQLNLTINQANCRTALLAKLEYPGVINLYGRHGCGKTALGWWLASLDSVIYLTEPQQVTLCDQNAILFVDNAESQRDVFRHILNDLERIRIGKAVIVTSNRVEDSIQAIELHCDTDDIQIACTNLTQLGYQTGSEQSTNLWYLVRDAALR